MTESNAFLPCDVDAIEARWREFNQEFYGGTALDPSMTKRACRAGCNDIPALVAEVRYLRGKHYE